jgi:hypothetical protein
VPLTAGALTADVSFPRGVDEDEFAGLFGVVFACSFVVLARPVVAFHPAGLADAAVDVLEVPTDGEAVDAALEKIQHAPLAGELDALVNLIADQVRLQDRAVAAADVADIVVAQERLAAERIG